MEKDKLAARSAIFNYIDHCRGLIRLSSGVIFETIGVKSIPIDTSIPDSSQYLGLLQHHQKSRDIDRIDFIDFDYILLYTTIFDILFRISNINTEKHQNTTFSFYRIPK